MNDEVLRRNLQAVGGEEPSPDFLDTLKSRLEDHSSMPGLQAEDEVVTMIDFEGEPEARRPGVRPIWALSAAAVVVGALFLALVLPNDDAPVDTATATEAREVGDAWLAAVVGNDREAFTVLHAEEFETDDTLMAYSKDVDVLTSARVADLYLDGFDAFQTSLTIDDDFVRADGCVAIGSQQVRCTYTASLIGTDEYTYTVAALLTVEDRLITTIAFAEVSTRPADLRSQMQGFLTEEANDEDRSCLVLGFNTVGCGVHDSDFMRRYIGYYEAEQRSSDE